MPCNCYVRQLADFVTNGVSYISTHIKSARRRTTRQTSSASWRISRMQADKMLVENRIRKNKKSLKGRNINFVGQKR